MWRMVTLALVQPCLLVLLAAAPAWAWGASGHRWLSRVAAESLPEELPAFLRATGMPATIGELGREPDRSRDAGTVADEERGAAHFVTLADDGKVRGVIPLEALPPTRLAYDSALRAAGSNQYQSGYLPYAIIGGWQQLRLDFAWWRLAAAAERQAETPADAAWLARDRARREALIVHDLGYWSHFVGDASQPLHVSIHDNGWGDHPDPNGYTTAQIHRRFEGSFVVENLTLADIQGAMRPYRDCGCTIEARTVAYLQATFRQVVPLYELEKAGGLASGDAETKAFVMGRLAAGAAELRDMVVDAWRASAHFSVGWPRISVAEVLSGQRKVTIPDLAGRD